MRFLMISLIVPLIVSCSISIKQQSFEDKVLAFMLSKDNKQGTFTVVKPNATVSMLGQSEELLISMCGLVSKQIDNNELDTCSLINRLVQKNKYKPPLSIESNRAVGYVIDKSDQFSNYFSEEGGGWDRWYKENPDAKCYTTVSLPVVDKKTDLVAIYIGTQCHWRVGVGYLVILTNTDGKFVEKHRVRLWVS